MEIPTLLCSVSTDHLRLAKQVFLASNCSACLLSLVTIGAHPVHWEREENNQINYK